MELGLGEREARVEEGDRDKEEQEPTDLFSMLRLSSSANNNHNNGKRRSTPSSSSGERSAKKLFCDQENITNDGFSAISLPLSLDNNGPVLRRCVSDRYNPPEHITPPPTRVFSLPPLPLRFTRCMSDLTPSPSKASSRSLSPEETTPDSMRLRSNGRASMKCLREPET